jgi:CheY-like chemotaxis protein
MPGRTGLEALEALRARDWSTPVLVMSAYLGLVDADEALRLGAAAVLSKPFDVTRFEHEVGRLVTARP